MAMNVSQGEASTLATLTPRLGRDTSHDRPWYNQQAVQDGTVLSRQLWMALTMRMLCFLLRCFVSKRKRLLTSLSDMLLYNGTP